jgi:hypothetical protein
MIWQCSSPVQSPSDARANGQTMSVAFAIKTNSEFNAVVRYALVTVTGYDMDSITQQMTIVDSLLYTSIPNIPLGQNRVFTIRAFDSTGAVRYSGSQTVSLDGSPTRVMIVLRKISGPVEIIGIIQDSSYWNDTTYYDTTYTDTTYNDTTYNDTTYNDTTYNDTTYNDTTYNDTTYTDTTYHDSTWIDGGPCVYDSAVGVAVFKSVTAYSGDTVYQASFNFRSPVYTRYNCSLYVSKRTARNITLNKPIPATVRYITSGTCTPEFFSVTGIDPVW